MPFDYDVAMDVLENLTVEERAAVLHSLNVLISPLNSGSHAGFKSEQFPARIYALMFSKVHSVSVTSEISTKPDGSIGNHVVVSFKCPAEATYGLYVDPRVKVPPTDEEKLNKLFDAMTLTREVKEVIIP